MKKPKPTWPGFMDEIKAVKKAPVPTDASFTAFFRETEGQNLTALPGCIAFLLKEMKQRKTPLRRRPE